MAPELFTSGHISRASDVYAFGVLLYEVVTGQRAYAGIAISMLPHRVAVEGLRPVWPSGVPTDLRRLAELCWVDKPQHRCGICSSRM
jgi:serine/threonine protein kinase